MPDRSEHVCEMCGTDFLLLLYSESDARCQLNENRRVFARRLLPLSVLFRLQRSHQQDMRISGGVLVTTLLLVQLTQAYGFCTPQFSAAWPALHQPAAGARQASRR